VILLDTHAAIWFTTDDEALGKDSRAIADAALAEGRLAVSAISFWEIALLIA
jgi:PIN domain nuclease of toxin-antitoxin system